jgi:hypothetical protein
MSENENKRNATERLEDLEKAMGQVIQHIQPLEQMAKDIMGLKEAMKLLNNKLDAVVKASNEEGPITDDKLSAFMVENNVKELAGKVQQMVNNGLLSSSDTVGKDSFVVINEADPSGKIVNPRMQFLVSALQNDEVKGKLDGAKVGSNIAIGDQGASINVLEAYNVVIPQPEAPASDATAEASAEAAPTSEAPAAPAAEASAAPAASTASA